MIDRPTTADRFGVSAPGSQRTTHLTRTAPCGRPPGVDGHTVTDIRERAGSGLPCRVQLVGPLGTMVVGTDGAPVSGTCGTDGSAGPGELIVDGGT